MTRNGLLKMIKKFEEIGELGMLTGKGQKEISNEISEVAIAMVDRASCFQYSLTNTHAVSKDLSIPWSTMQKIL